MIKEHAKNLEPGMLVQLNPKTVRNKMFSACILVITELKPWGCQGYVQALGENGEPGGLAYYRPSFDEFDFVGYTIWEIKGDHSDD